MLDFIKQKQAEIERKRQAEGQSAVNPFDSWRAKADKAREAMQKRKEEVSPATNQKPTPPTKKTNIEYIAPNPDMSISEVRLENFKTANGRLSKNKSQLPNLAVQARIFEPVTPGRRKFYKEWRNIPVPSRNDIKVEHKFHQLNQLDLTGWLMLIKFAGHDFISAFTRYEFLRKMKKQDSSRDYKWLKSFIDRIGTSPFCITLFYEDNSWEKYRGPLAPQCFERSDGKFAVQLSKPLAAMFGFDGWSFINIEQRLELGQNQFAQAFHAWASTHTCPKNGLWWKKEDLWKEWGQGYKELENFMRQFRRRVLKPLYNVEFIKKVEEKKTSIGLWW